jgi:DNA polymerase I-like protein with 3'-5' exonuclease and polymerase domains
LHRADSGRIASGSAGIEKEGASTRQKIQQMQNYPKPIRDIFVAAPGYSLFNRDYSGIEWAITMHDCAHLNQPAGFHEDLLSRFRTGDFDPHAHLAAATYNVAPEDVDSDQRQSVKQFTHGRTYAGSPDTLGRKTRITPARSFAYAIDKQLIVAGRCHPCNSNPRDIPLHIRNKHNGFRSAIFQMICDVHEEAFRVGYWQKFLKEQTKRRHYVETPLGWRRYFWAYEPKLPEVLATRISATAGDLLKWILVRMFSDWPHPTWEMWTTTHDSVILHVPTQDIPDAAVWSKTAMEQPIPWLGGRSFRTDAKSGHTWKEVS